ncbi:hypothetical protein ACFONC_10710 [Luteimonas soli]|uniref:Uncharacterized protein n=1 Tax=Luteimonas soli TaxID=1648966 RepID=A0ABV7XP53_9GAMM
MQSSSLFVPAALAFALAAASAPAGAQSTQADLYIDVATHAMPGMGGLGALGRFAGNMSGGNASYGMARHPGMPGKYMDVALDNRNKPGAPASQAIPKGLRLGDEIDLLPPERKARDGGGADNASTNMALADGGPYTIRYYWGCGEQVRAGQPATFTMSVRNGKPVNSGRAMTPRSIPQHGIDPGPQHVLWPNPSSRKSVSSKASLVGTHHLSGDGVPGSMQFDLGREHDFLPELELDRETTDQGTLLSWKGVDGANAYFIHATAMDGETVVMWSSAQDGYAGPELVDYLPESLVAQWTKKRTLLGADARSCRIPSEVFAGGAPMVQMIAYGNERTIAQPGWRVRVRNKSTAMLMPSGAAAAPRATQESAKPSAKGLLRGLFGR